MYAVIRAGGKQYRSLRRRDPSGEVGRHGRARLSLATCWRFPPRRGVWCRPEAGAQRERRSGGAGPRREDSGVPLQAQEAI